MFTYFGADSPETGSGSGSGVTERAYWQMNFRSSIVMS
jgi:hypothetical protein